MQKRWRFAAIAALCMWAGGVLAADTPVDRAVSCPEAEGCVMPEGRYFAFVPAGSLRHIVVFLHGFGGSGRSEWANADFRQWAAREHVALILPDGLGSRWSVLRDRAEGRDDIGFIAGVLADARARLGLPDVPVVLSGFSLGGSMVWNIACSGRMQVAGYVPFSGAFWEPAPASCPATMAPVVHFHATNDTVVPLEGREVRSGRRQAHFDKAVSALAATNQCPLPPQWQPAAASPAGATCADLAACRTAGSLIFCAHGDGHNLRLDWLSFALERIDAAAKRH